MIVESWQTPPDWCVWRLWVSSCLTLKSHQSLCFTRLPVPWTELEHFSLKVIQRTEIILERAEDVDVNSIWSNRYWSATQSASYSSSNSLFNKAHRATSMAIRPDTSRGAGRKPKSGKNKTRGSSQLWFKVNSTLIFFNLPSLDQPTYRPNTNTLRCCKEDCRKL